MTKLPKALFLSHGGGPMPLLGDKHHHEMIECLSSLAATIPKPDAIVVISAHWEEAVATITSAANPELIYDYYGFPDESYQIQYPCPGNPSLASTISDLLEAARIPNRVDATRGLDHGVFVPMKIMYPEANIPCVQLSLVSSLDPMHHIKIGQALRALREKNILIIGSGFSFHNLKAFFSTTTTVALAANEGFEGWLSETCSRTDLTEAERTQALVNWEDAPGARFCHPREEHLIPLHVCYGVAEAACVERIEITIFGKKSSVIVW